ncbi:MAG TPA: hypothetical protein VHE55_18115 [Fimbriimonadaceae bacterium]|nr:hypothetical protein [Fimbriimonadaceae bacterium]
MRAVLDPLSGAHNFGSLSLSDLLQAREQFHVHLMNKDNVVATAVGRYLIRKSDPCPGEHADHNGKPKGPKRLEDAEVRDYSWPSILVFVSRWEEPEAFHGARSDDFVPRAVYMPDGRVVPICVVLADKVERQPDAAANVHWPTEILGGGYPILADVQGEEHVATAGCMVTDGHTAYMLTNRHVAGQPGEVLFTLQETKKVRIGVSAAIQGTKIPACAVHSAFAGSKALINIDAGLVEVDDKTRWTAQIYRIGRLGRLADVAEENMSLRLIGAEVMACGASSQLMTGAIFALFYRYTSVGGVESMTEYVIGPSGSSAFSTLPGDSGTLWNLVDGDEKRPLALQWGGHVFVSGRGSSTSPYALATGLSTICRELGVEVVRDWAISDDYWGMVGHLTIANRAIQAVRNSNLAAFMGANLRSITFDNQQLSNHASPGDPNSSFIPLSDVPDLVWKKSDGGPRQVRGGRDSLSSKSEHPNHFADMDKADSNGQTLLQICQNPANINPARWIQYYQDPAVGEDIKHAGLLPFRVGQLYKIMVEAAAKDDAVTFLTASGVVSHYVGDACQPLHISYLHDGDPANGRTHTVHHRDGTTSDVTDPVAMGVHSDYEDLMIDDNTDEILGFLQGSVSPGTGALFTGPQGAANAVVNLMQQTFGTLPPGDIVAAYTDALGQGIRKKSHPMADFLWSKFRDQTLRVLTEGSVTLALLWDSAWAEATQTLGREPAISGVVDQDRLVELYSDPSFAPSLTIDQIQSVL